MASTGCSSSGACGAGDVLRQAVGLLGVALPDAGLDVGEQLRGHVARLSTAGARRACGAARSRAPVPDRRTPRPRRPGPVLGGPEREHVDAGTPGDIARVAVEERDDVGKARPVHVHLHAALVRKFGQHAAVPAAGTRRPGPSPAPATAPPAARCARPRAAVPAPHCSGSTASRPCSPGSSINWAPPEKNPGAPHSSTAMWDSSCAKIAP